MPPLGFDEDLSTLQRHYPIASIIARCNHVLACYYTCQKETRFDGRLVVFQCEPLVHPAYGISVIKGRDEIAHIQHLCSEDDINIVGSVLEIQSCGSSRNAFADLYGNRNLSNFHQDMPAFLKLYGVAEGMLDSILRLRLCVRGNEANSLTASGICEEIEVIGDRFACGGNADIYKGQLWDCRGQRIAVAIKILRARGLDDGGHEAIERRATVNRRIDREVKVWESLDHPNVLRFFGVSHKFGPLPALVSPYCHFHDVVSYLKSHPDAARWPIVQGLTRGVYYLHSREIVHGDLKGTNILVDSNGNPLICDFGISKVIGFSGFTTSTLFGTPAFMAPELFPDVYAMDSDVEFRPNVTKETDVYAYGLVVMQILTNKSPRHYNPLKPKDRLVPEFKHYGPVNDRLWAFFRICCNIDPKERPSMAEVMDLIPPMVETPIFSTTSTTQATASSPALRLWMKRIFRPFRLLLNYARLH